MLYWGVSLMQFYPWQSFAVAAWRMGQAPLWNPLVGNGAPLAANLQTGAFYPLNFLYLLLPTEYAMGSTAAMHVALAGLFMFAFARALGLRSVSALIAAIAFQLSGFLISRFGFLTITAALPWLAAWLWRAERAMQSGRRRDAAWLSITIGLGLLAGHAQTSLYGLMLLAAYVLYRVFTTRREGMSRMASLAVAGAGVALGLGLAALQLLPAAELAGESQRVGGLDYTLAMTHSYWPWRLLTLLAPDLFGNPGYGNFWGYDNYWENAAYIGLFPLGLAAYALKEWWRVRRMNASREGGRMKDEEGHAFRIIPFFLLAAFVTLVLAFGWFTPIYPFLFHNLPGFSLFQGPARWLSVVTIALCVLAGIGAELTFEARERGNLRRGAVWIVIGMALIGAGLASRSFLSGRAATFPGETLRLGVLVALGGLLLGLRPSRQARSFAGWAAAFVVVVAADLLTAHAALNPTIDPAVYRLPIQSAAAIRVESRAGRVFMFDADDDRLRNRAGILVPFPDFGPRAVDDWIHFRETLIANTSMIDGVATANNFDPLLVNRPLQVRNAINDLPLEVALRVLSLMNVRYVASTRELNLPVVQRGAWATLYLNADALPRAWIVPVARAESEPLAAILAPGFDPRNEVVLDATARSSRITFHACARAAGAGVSRFTVYSLQDTSNAITIRAASDGAGYLVLSDTWYPGWRATIDGQAVDVLRANYAFRAVAFPAGEHVVEFRYEPDSFRVGLWISAFSLLIVAGLWAGRQPHLT